MKLNNPAWQKNYPPPPIRTFQLLPSATPNWNWDQKQPKSHELTWFPKFSGWVIYATVFHQQENTITKCKQRLKTPTIWITVQGAAGEEQECSVVLATPQTLLPNEKKLTTKTPQIPIHVAWQLRSQVFQLQPMPYTQAVSSVNSPHCTPGTFLELPGAVATPHSHLTHICPPSM